MKANLNLCWANMFKDHFLALLFNSYLQIMEYSEDNFVSLAPKHIHICTP